MTISGAVMQGGQALSPDGALYVKLDSGSAITGTTITATTAFRAPNGTASIASFGFTNSNASGLYFVNSTLAWTDGGHGGYLYGGGTIVKSTGRYSFTNSATDGITQDAMITRYAAKQLMISGDGTGATTNAGWILGYEGTNSGYSALWSTTITPSVSNYALRTNGATTNIGASGSGGIVQISPNNVTKMQFDATAGAGPSIIAGTAADNTGRALSISQTWTDGTTGNIGIVGNFDLGATGTATGKLLSLQAGAAGTTEVFYIDQVGNVGISGTTFGVVGQFTYGLGLNSFGFLRAPSDGVVTITDNAETSFGRLQFGGTTSSFPALKRNGTTLEVKLADDSAYAPIAIGNTVNSVSPTSPNRTVTINIGGTTYYLAAKTTND